MWGFVLRAVPALVRVGKTIWKFRKGITVASLLGGGAFLSVKVAKYTDHKLKVISFTIQGLIVCLLTLQWRRFSWLLAQAKFETNWVSSYFLEHNNGFGMHYPQQRYTFAKGFVTGDGGQVAVYSCYALSWLDRIWWDFYVGVPVWNRNFGYYCNNVVNKGYHADYIFYVSNWTNVFETMPWYIKTMFWFFAPVMLALGYIAKRALKKGKRGRGKRWF